MFFYRVYSEELLNQLAEEDRVEDVSLITADEKVIHASKDVLATFSPFFRDLFG
jgi:cobalamin biosynthesis Mg chelatase CobN